MILPKSYLSYSAASLWYASKSAYRSRYYYNAPGMSSVQTDYGKEVADMIKDDPTNPVVSHIPKYPIRDEGFTVDISGVPVLMYPDTLSLDGIPSFREYKTSAVKDGWTQRKVNEHMQLKLYSLGIKEKYGAVNNLCHLDWLVTEMLDITNPILINGKQYETTIQVPKMTGQVITFPCVVTDIERFRARQWIVGAAAEIEADYKSFLRLSTPPVDSSQVV